MKILLTGATGFIGQSVLSALLARGDTVLACGRRANGLLVSSPQLIPVALDFSRCLSVEDWLPHLSGVDAVINCVGIIAETGTQRFSVLHHLAPAALFKAAELAGVKKVIQISALGADEQATTNYHLSKKAADDVLRGLNLDWFVLQPSVVYGAAAQSSALLHALSALPVQCLPDGGKQLLQPIDVQDVVATVCACLLSTSGKKTLALVGQDAVSYADLLQGFRRRLGKSPALSVSVPLVWLERLTSLSKVFNEPILSKDNIAMLSRGNSADSSALSAFLQHTPHSVQELLNTPATTAERWYADLYFFKLLLCWVIAFVWLWSGVTSLFFYPHSDSYALLAKTGVTGNFASVMLYGLAIMDIGFAVLTLLRYRVGLVMMLQVSVVLVYSIVVAFCLPEFLVHPFGALLKNLPFLLCLLMYQAMAGERS